MVEAVPADAPSELGGGERQRPARPAWLKDAESMWTIVAVEPITVRLAPRLAALPAVTPNRITAVAAVLGVASAASFLFGLLLLGGVLFQLRYIADCLDGKVARLRSQSSARGGAFDLLVDVTSITVNFAALAWFLAHEHGAPPVLAVLVVASSTLFAWALAYRKDLEGQLRRALPVEVAAAGATGARRAPGPGPRTLASRYLAFMARHRSMPVPYAVEAEILGLSLGPIAAAAAGAPEVAVACLWVVAAFYVPAVLVNGRRVLRIAGQIDEARSAGGGRY